jgi:hypothetical protein
MLVAEIAERQHREQGKNAGIMGFHAYGRDIAAQADI